MTITSKSTKPEILKAYRALEAQASSQTITMPLARNTAIVVWTELVAFAQDTYRFGAWCRKGFDRVLDELRLIVKN